MPAYSRLPYHRVPSETPAIPSSFQPDGSNEQRHSEAMLLPAHNDNNADISEQIRDDYELDTLSAHISHLSDHNLQLRLDESDYRKAPRISAIGQARSDSSNHDNYSVRSKLSSAPWIPRPRMWNPIWLETGVLIVFAITFALMCTAVMLLYYFSEQENGLATQHQSRHYAWTYGPTALLTLVASLFRQVDSSNKRLVPWQGLFNGPAEAENTILVDYITPILPTTLYRAAKHKHWAIVASTVGLLLIKLSTVFSTGLIVLEPTLVSSPNITFSLDSKFDAIGYSIWNISSTAAERYYGIRTEGLQYPLGTGPDLVVQSFVPQLPLASESTYSAEVLGFKPELDCEILDIPNSSLKTAYLPWFSIQAQFFTVNISTPDCNIKNVIVAETANHGYFNQPDATQNFQGRIDNYTCSDGVDNSLASFYRPDNTNRYPEHRVLMTMADLHWNAPDFSIDKQTDGTTAWWVSNLSAVLCRPSYTMSNYRVEYAALRNASQGAVNAVQTSNSTQLPGFTDADLGATVTLAQDQMNIGTGGQDYVLANPVVNFFQVLAAANNGSRQEAFMNATLLRDLGSEVWEGMAAQVVLDNLMVGASNDVVVGEIEHSENRLQVKKLSTVLMAILFALLCCISILVLWFRPQDVVPCDPGSIFATMAILTASPTFAGSLSELGSARSSKIKQAVTRYSFHSDVSQEKAAGFAIHTTAKELSSLEAPISSTAEQSSTKSAFRWWLPVASRRWFHFLAFLLPLIIVALLEVLQHISDSHQGIVPVDSDTGLNSRVLASYIPAVTMLVVATIYNSIETTSAIFAPYHKLRRGNLSARSLQINTDFMHKIPPHALYLTVKASNFGHATCILAVFVAAFLTVVVSGLYSVIEVPGHFDTTLTKNDEINFGVADFSINDGGAAAVTSMIEYANLTFPPWTYGGLIFDEVAPSDNVPASGFITTQVPAFKAVLNCTIGYDYSLSIYEQDPDGISEISVEEGKSVVIVEAKVPLACERMHTNYTSTIWSQVFHVPNDTSIAYVGKGTMLQWAVNGSESSIGSGPGPIVVGDGAIVATYSGPVQTTVQAMSTGNYGCPTFGFSIGTAAIVPAILKNGTKVLKPEANLTLAMCYQNLEQVQTDVTLDLPDLSINLAQPPAPDKTTATLLRNTSGSQIWEWPVNNMLAMLTNITTRPAVLSPSGGDPANNDIDAFIETLVQGKADMPIQNMIGEQGIDSFVKASAGLYSEYMAQAFTATVRTPTNQPLDANVTYSAAVGGVPRFRLQQNRSPKIALQVMLSVLAAAAVATYLLADVRRVLPHKPCSIAGVATLLVDSGICTRDLIPEGAEWASERELKAADVLGNLRLKMGWFETEGKGRVFGIHAHNDDG